MTKEAVIPSFFLLAYVLLPPGFHVAGVLFATRYRPIANPVCSIISLDVWDQSENVNKKVYLQQSRRDLR